MTGVAGAFLSFVRGLFGTRQQLTYAVVGSYVFVLLRGALAAKTSSDYVALMNVAWPGVLLVLGAWMGDRHLERKAANGQNGDHA